MNQFDTTDQLSPQGRQKLADREKKMRLRTLAARLTLCAGAICVAPAAHADEQVVNVYNWGNAIGKDTIANFEKATGIKVVYQEFDSDHTLQAKLLAGSSGYDVVSPSNTAWSRQIQLGVYQKIDTARIKNFSRLDPDIMALIEKADPTQSMGLPWSWGTDGLGMNVEKVTSALGATAPLNSLSLLFDPENAQKLKSCGISMVDSPIDVFSAALVYLKKDPNSRNPSDYEQAYQLLKGIRPYITQFNSSTYINDLAGGDVCLAYGWSGDVETARARAAAAKKTYHIRYVIPEEGGAAWFDMVAIPKDAPHREAALKWIDFVLSDKESASLTNSTSFPAANLHSKQWVTPDLASSPSVYPSPAQFQKLFIGKPMPLELQKLVNRLWTKLKAG
ncbi:extracellular solute-binding protein [Paraburkholderia sediminicola]